MTLDEAKQAWEAEQASWSEERREFLRKQPALFKFAKAKFYEDRGFLPHQYSL
jgi:hypothetical protein